MTEKEERLAPTKPEGQVGQISLMIKSPRRIAYLFILSREVVDSAMPSSMDEVCGNTLIHKKQPPRPAKFCPSSLPAF